MPETSTSKTSKETASKRSRHASRHVRQARAVMHAGIANPRWREKRSRHSWRMRHPQFYVSDKRPIISNVQGRYACIVLLNISISIRRYMQRYSDCINHNSQCVFSIKLGAFVTTLTHWQHITLRFKSTAYKGL